MDLVGTVPMARWEEWIEEGDLPGDEWLGDYYGWETRDHTAKNAHPGDLFYIVAHGKLRGYAPVARVIWWEGAYRIIRGPGAVACTLPDEIKGFRGLRVRWWSREREIAFPDWRQP